MIVKEYTLYPDRKDVTLTAYIIGEKGELHVQGKRPAVLICPGGAYFGCSDRESEPVALAFAAMGYHAFVLRYSTWLEGEAGFPDFVHFQLKPHLAHPAPVREIGMAMLLIRKNSGRWMVDTDRIAVCGFSAGAHNVRSFKNSRLDRMHALVGKQQPQVRINAILCHNPQCFHLGLPKLYIPVRKFFSGSLKG